MLRFNAEKIEPETYFMKRNAVIWLRRVFTLCHYVDYHYVKLRQARIHYIGHYIVILGIAMLRIFLVSASMLSLIMQNELKLRIM
jgi:hypothetical protein